MHTTVHNYVTSSSFLACNSRLRSPNVTHVIMLHNTNNLVVTFNTTSVEYHDYAVGHYTK